MCASLPLAVTLAIALGFNTLNEFLFERFGYLIQDIPARYFERSVLVFALVQLVVVVLFACIAWLRASDRSQAAEHIDRIVGGKQEVVTFTALSALPNPEAATMRYPLFPILSGRVNSYLQAFDPRSAFPLELRQPLIRSSILATLVVVIITTVASVLIRRPTAAQSVTHRLQLLADALDASASSSAHQQLSVAARDVAKDLMNPKLPPRVRLAELISLEQELDKSRDQHRVAQAGRGRSPGSGNGGGESAAKGSGVGNGSGASRAGGKGGKGEQENQMADLRNDIAKAQTKLEQETEPGTKGQKAQNSSNGSGASSKPGSDPDRPGGQNSSSGNGQVPPKALAGGQNPNGQNPSTRPGAHGSMGDTHLGEFPKPGNYQRFYKPGERGPGINVRDARFVTFQLPTAIASTGAGVLVPGNMHPQATTPYINSPLKQERLEVSPDEQQLVPPRYRDLLR